VSSVSEFRGRYPQFAADPRLAAFLTDAADDLDAETWGTTWARAVYALTAHRIERSPLGGRNDIDDPIAGDAPRKQTRPPVSVSGASLDEAVLMSTTGGRDFLELRARCPGRVFGVVLAE